MRAWIFAAAAMAAMPFPIVTNTREAPYTKKRLTTKQIKARKKAKRSKQLHK